MKGVAVAAGLIALTACAAATPKITFVPNGPAPSSPRPAACEIAVFRDAKPERRYTELGVINYHDERHRLDDRGLSVDTALAEIKARACQAGADAVIIRVTESRRLEFAMFHVAATALRFEP
jgi:hypothetical protein